MLSGGEVLRWWRSRFSVGKLTLEMLSNVVRFVDVDNDGVGDEF